MLLGSLQGIFYPYYRGMVNYVKRKIMFLLYIGKETCRWICSLWQWMVHNLGINAWVLFIELLWGTRIKIIPRIYTTAEKLSKINNVAPPGRLGKHKTKQTKNPWVFWADITAMFGMDLVSAKAQKGANLLNMSSSGRKFWTTIQTSYTSKADFLLFLSISDCSTV